MYSTLENILVNFIIYGITLHILQYYIGQYNVFGGGVERDYKELTTSTQLKHRCGSSGSMLKLAQQNQKMKTRQFQVSHWIPTWSSLSH